MAHLGEAGGVEDAAVADEHLVPRDLLAGLRDHRVALDRAGTAFAREVRGRLRERVGDASMPESLANEEAGHRPDVGSALSSLRPSHGTRKTRARPE